MIENKEEFDALECEIVGEDETCFDGGHTKKENTQKKMEFIGSEKCSKICEALSELIAGRKGKKWKLSPDEVDQLGSALDPVLAKYLPTDGNDISAELGLALVAFSIIVPRLGSGDE